MSRRRPGGPPRFIVVDKSAGPSSFDCVRRIRSFLGERRVGHGGTLDPFATGVLVCAAGSATRLLGLLSEGRKEYLAELRFGVLTDSLDPTGEIIERGPVDFSLSDLKGACESFVGEQMQVPPRLSAVHVDGQRSYRRFRQGDTDFELEARRVRIDEIEVTDFGGDRAELRVVCGGGTYIRSLARDLAQTLGTVAHLSALRRTRVGEFDLEHAIDYPRLLRIVREKGERDELAAHSCVLSPAHLVRNWPQLVVDEHEALRIRQGQQPSREWLALPDPLPSRLALLDANEQLVAVAEQRDNCLRLRTVLPPWRSAEEGAS